MGATREPSDKALARRGLAFNLAFGTSVEACFPFLRRDPYLSAAACVASAASGAIMANGGARGTAYLAAPLAVTLSDNPMEFAKAAFVGFALPFAVGIVSNRWALRKEEELCQLVPEEERNS